MATQTTDINSTLSFIGYICTSYSKCMAKCSICHQNKEEKDIQHFIK